MNEDRARGFAAFPPSKARGRRGGSWWGNAWIQAMEDTALDIEQLRRGRRYASSGTVGPITVSPGRIAATVQGIEPYRTEVLLEPLSDAEWERFLDRVAARAGHIAALLDRDMPQDLVDAAEDAGVRLLPGIGDLEPECSCDGWELPCRHAAALCYQVAWLLDADPFVLLLLRGRGERELLSELQRRNVSLSTWEPTVSGSTVESPEAEGVPAGLAYGTDPAPLPDPPPVTEPLGAGFSLALPPVPGIDADALELLVTDAAARARAVLGGETLPVLDVWQDAVRLATAANPRIVARLRHGGDGEFDRGVRAWQYGGATGLRVLRTPWSPGRAELARVSAAFADTWEQQPSVWRNRCSLAGAQLRYGPDERWYPYRQLDGEWWPAGPPHRTPDSALAELLS